MEPPFSSLDLDEPGNDKQINDSTNFLKLDMNRISLLLKNWQQKREDLRKWVNEELRKQLNKMEKKNIVTKQAVVSLGTALEQERKKKSALETRLMNIESQLSDLQHQLQQKDVNLTAAQHETSALETKLMNLESRLSDHQNQLIAARHEIEEKYSLLRQQIAEREKLRQQFIDDMAGVKNQMTDIKQKLREGKEVVTKDSCHTPVQPLRSATSLETNSIHARVPLLQNSKRDDVVPTSIMVRSPNATRARKRNASTSELQDTEAACAVAVEGHKRMHR